MEQLIPLVRRGEPFYRQVYGGLRQAILVGTFRGGDRLPSTRDLAEQLRISRTVVVLAYEQLLAEGYVVGRGGSGTYVASGVSPRRPGVARSAAQLRLTRFGAFASSISAHVTSPERHVPAPRYDFAYGRSDVSCFPFEAWRRMLLRCARKASVRELDYASSTGSDALREAICAHLRRSRAVACEPSQVLIVSGSQQALYLISRVLIERGDRVAIEDPAYNGTTEILRAAGARVHPIPVDRDGLDVAAIPDTAKMAFVTPSHQFPTGVILSLARRQALLDWARRRNAVIVEDDYDGEFRYEGQRLESLQGMDAEGRVVYVGTFSRTIFSALRIGYLVVPKPLQRAFAAAKWLCDRHTATLEQEALAEFISSGLYERHLRRVRRRNAVARGALMEAIHKYLGERVEVTGESAGAHVALWLDGRLSEQQAIAAAAAKGVGVYATSRYFAKTPTRPGLLLGYARLREADIREGIRRLASVL
jgi:GntR family transcriptional regulator/MocR family aminotransferase